MRAYPRIPSEITSEARVATMIDDQKRPFGSEKNEAHPSAPTMRPSGTNTSTFRMFA